MTFRRLPILEADTGHAFSGGPNPPHTITVEFTQEFPGGGTLSEREPSEAVANSPVASRTSDAVSRSESVSFTARRCYGNTGMWATLEEPACQEVCRWPTQEAAEASYTRPSDRFRRERCHTFRSARPSR